MKYSKLCETYEELEKNPSRLKKTEILAGFLKQLKKEIEKHEEDKELVYLLQGRIFPDYDPREIGISGQLTIKALAKATGKPEAEIVKKWKKTGDLGEVAAEMAGKKSQSTLFSAALTTEKVLENLKELPKLTGKGSVDRKMGLIAELLSSATPIEAKYIVRTLLNDLRIGTGAGTIRDAIVSACFGGEKDEKEQKDDKKTKEVHAIVQSAYDKSNDFAEVFERACKHTNALDKLDKIELSPGRPLKVMLALKAENIADGFERAGRPCAFEFKYDGFRMLINKDKNGVIKVFTRRLDEVTTQFPEVAEYVKNYVKAETFIIDSEAVGYNKKTKKYLPFQSISQRIKRKYGIEKMAEDFPVEINAFDILYLDGKSMIDEPFKERTKALRKIIKSEKWKFVASKQIITSDDKEAEKFYKEALAEGEEGVMIKNLETPYQPGARVGHMLKLKPVTNEFDLVITGAEYGTGKRGGWLSSFDISCRDENTGDLMEIGKVSTGVKEKSESAEEGTGDATYEELTKLLKPLITKESGKTVKVKPKIVITVIYQNIQRSPSYNSGFALRFPRFVALRTDRSVHDIATLKEIEKEYNRARLRMM